MTQQIKSEQAAPPEILDEDWPCGEGMCQCRCWQGHACGCDCGHDDECDCLECEPETY
ncbi:hypothetical protein [Streptomyces sp. NBC_01565]|uniref:hypothetical protein n=1 Tax=Streptomyces sp. NBC_01565 TaxID=2975881 RepID=UPI002250FB62|nr:hypothetical protein [Streptomyces sp. NBC_01565]MCX4543792.1 hypothetical protein [Streptomyces sp. NBC_01565]